MLITFSSGNSIEIVYDAADNKLRKIVRQGSTVQYEQDYSGGLEYRKTPTSGTFRSEALYHEEGRYYNLNVETNNTVSWRKEYALRDHLGNTRIMFADKNANGIVEITGNASTNEILQENHYYPFGLGFEEPAWMNDAARDNRYQYNGKEWNDDFGLNWNDYGARWYDAAVGRWWVVDALTDHPNQVDKSPYAYAWNNPINQTDPDGNCPTCPTAAIGAVVGGLFGGGIELGRQLWNDGKVSSWSAVGGSALQGAVTGSAAGFTGGASLLTTAAVAGGANAVGGTANRTIQGQSTTLANVVTDATVGAVLGAGSKVVGNAVSNGTNNLSNSAKGKLGEAITEVKYGAQGYSSVGNDVVKTGGKTATGREAVAKFDHKMTNVLTGKQITVESKFNKSGLTPNQSAVVKQGYNVTVDRTTSQGLGNATKAATVGAGAGVDAQRNKRP